MDDDQLDVHKEFQESLSKRSDGRYELGVPWISGAKLSTDILVADLQKVFLQIAIKNEDRDAFRFLFNIQQRGTLIFAFHKSAFRSRS